MHNSLTQPLPVPISLQVGIYTKNYRQLKAWLAGKKLALSYVLLLVGRVVKLWERLFRPPIYTLE